MKDKNKIFLDTNLLIYAHTNIDVPKQRNIHLIITNEQTVISTQVLKEVANVLYKKFKLGWQDIKIVLQELQENSTLHVNASSTIERAIEIADRYRFSFYDSLILASALEAGCSFLYSEDMQNGQTIAEVLTIKNPFL